MSQNIPTGAKPADNTVQLGCGTLILIALIVMFFSGGDDARKLKRQLDASDERLQRLEQKIDNVLQKLAEKP